VSIAVTVRKSCTSWTKGSVEGRNKGTAVTVERRVGIVVR
jgi:hypothetical protein